MIGPPKIPQEKLDELEGACVLITIVYKGRLNRAGPDISKIEADPHPTSAWY